MPLLAVASVGCVTLPMVSCGGNEDDPVEPTEEIKITAPTTKLFAAVDTKPQTGANHLHAEITGFTVEGAKVEDLTLNLETDAYVWVGELDAKIVKEDANDSSKFKIVLDMEDEYYLQVAGDYRLFFEIKKGNTIVFTSSDIYVAVKENLVAPTVLEYRTSTPIDYGYGYSVIEYYDFTLQHLNFAADFSYLEFHFYDLSDGEEITNAIYPYQYNIDYGIISFRIPDGAITEDTNFCMTIDRIFYDGDEWVVAENVLTKESENNDFHIDFQE